MQASLTAAQAEALRTQVFARNWHHQIDLGGGLVTPGPDQSARKLAALGLPGSLAGRSVIDVGAWDGFFSFAAEAMGAARVLATDHFCWGASGVFDKGGFDLARRALGSQVEELRITVEELSPETVGAFDVVLFLGVLYHAPDPLGYLRRCRSICRGVTVIETHVDLLEIATPALAYYPAGALNGDGSNFFGPNPAAVVGMCQDAGYARIEMIPGDLGPDRRVFHAFV